MPTPGNWGWEFGLHAPWVSGEVSESVDLLWGSALNSRSKDLQAGGAKPGVWVHLRGEQHQTCSKSLTPSLPKKNHQIQHMGPKSWFLASPSCRALPFVKPVH